MRESRGARLRDWLRRVGPEKLLLVGPLLLAAISLPMALRIVPPNGFYGLRTSETLSSAEVWYRSNLQAGIAGVALGLAGAALVFATMRISSLTEEARVLLAGAVVVLIGFASLIAGLVAI
jgi:uncharacterized membrane protein